MGGVLPHAGVLTALCCSWDHTRRVDLQDSPTQREVTHGEYLLAATVVTMVTTLLANHNNAREDASVGPRVQL